MLGWFKNKFGKKEEEIKSPADFKIPVAPRTFPAQPLEEELEEAPGADTTELEEPAVSEEVEEPAVEQPAVADTQVEESAFEEVEHVFPEEALAEEVIEREEPAATEQTKVPHTQPPVEEAPPVEAEDEASAGEEIPETPQPETAGSAGHAPLPEEPEKQGEPRKKSFLTRLSDRLSRTRENFTYQLDTLFLGKKEIDAKLLDDLEELLITADLGFNVTLEILDQARRKVKRKELSDPKALKQVLKDKLKSFVLNYQQDATLVMPDEGPFVIMVVGVNGVGKTTTIGKIAHKFLRSGQSVLLVAADTFRAAAVSQLKIWGERNKVPVIAKEEGADPSSVVYDGIAHAKAKGFDVVLVDTAGRLHTQANLMEELKKIKRVMSKQLEGAPHEVMLVVDATTGQNGISQAKLFNEAVELTGLTLTKLDGTAKGGIVINICREMKLPIRFIGVGEQLDDLRDFEPDEFIEALFLGRNKVQA